MVIVQWSLERIAEHDLRDPHKSGLIIDLAEVRVAERVCVQVGLHVDTVEQVQHFDLHLSRFALAQSEVLHE